MSRVYNFSAGPAVLPEPVLKEVADEMMDYQGTGMSVMEMSHRSPEFQKISTGSPTELNTIVRVTRPTLGTPAVPTEASVAVPITVT